MKLVDKLDGIKNKRVLVIGDAIVDHNIHGDCSRLSPEGPYKVFGVDSHEYLLGGAANVAHNARALGSLPTLCYVAGDDAAGMKLKKAAEEKGVQTIPVHEKERRTTEKIRLFAGDIRMDPRIDEETTKDISEKSGEKILNVVREKVSDIDVIILSDYSKGVFTKNIVKKVIEEAKKQNVVVVVAPKPQSVNPNVSLLNNVDAIIMNNKEASEITNVAYTGKESLKTMGNKILEEIQTRYVIITCGKDGMFCFDHDKKSHFIPTQAHMVSDVTGAGDTSTTVLALAIAAGFDIDEALTVANYAAGIVVEKAGTATVSFDELKERINE